MMALAPATVQRMPARLSRAPICLQPASSTPDDDAQPFAASGESRGSGSMAPDRDRPRRTLPRLVLHRGTDRLTVDADLHRGD